MKMYTIIKLYSFLNFFWYLLACLEATPCRNEYHKLFDTLYQPTDVFNTFICVCSCLKQFSFFFFLETKRAHLREDDTHDILIEKKNQCSERTRHTVPVPTDMLLVSNIRSISFGPVTNTRRVCVCVCAQVATTYTVIIIIYTLLVCQYPGFSIIFKTSS